MKERRCLQETGDLLSNFDQGKKELTSQKNIVKLNDETKYSKKGGIHLLKRKPHSPPEIIICLLHQTLIARLKLSRKLKYSAMAYPAKLNINI